MGQLNVVIGILTKSFAKENEEVIENTVVSKVNEKQQKKGIIAYLGLSRAIKTTSRSMRVLNNAFKATAIGALIAALAALAAFFKKTQDGADALARSTDKLKGGFEVVAGRAGTLAGEGIDQFTSGVGLLFDGLKAKLTGNDEALKKVQKRYKEVSERGVKVLKEQTDGLGEAIVNAANKSAELGDKLRKLAKDSIPIREEIARLNAEAEKAEEVEGDATKSFVERANAIQIASLKQSEAADKNLDLLRQEFQIEKELLQLKEDSGTVKTEDLQEFSNKQIELIEAEKDAELKALQITRVANQLRQDEIEKNLDILIDGFDNQKTVNETLIADEKRRFDARRKLLVDTINLQKRILTEEVSEIQRATKKELNIRELIDEQDSRILNEKIRAYGLSEILEGRLLEVVRESRTQERELAQELLELDRQRAEQRKEIADQLEDLRAQNIEGEKQQALELQSIDEQRAIEEIETRQEVYSKDSEEFKNLELQKTEIKTKGVEDRETIEIDALKRADDRQQKSRELELIQAGNTQEEINEELTKLKIEQLEKEIKLDEKFGRDAIDKELELAKLKNKIAIDEEKKKSEQIQAIQDATAQAGFDSFQKRFDKQLAELDKLEGKQKEQIDKQEQRSQAGLENNLAFEEKALADIEQKKIKAQKKQIQLDKLRALYSAYSAAAASGDNNAIVNVLRDFSILQGLESAILSFGSGTGEHGDISDVMSANQNGSKNGNSIQNGVVRGESHAKRGHGIPVLVEGNEGIWKGSTMAKFGKSNFVALTKAIDSGSIGSNFMQPQVNAMQVVQQSGGDSRLLNEMKATRQAIENKPEQIVDVEKVTRGVMDFIDERKSGNKRIINRHRMTKKRF